MQSDEEVVSEKYGSITVISLNRPKQLNAISKAMAAKLSDAILTFENDETASVGILHGVGGNFSCGHDLEELREDVNDAARFLGDDGFAVCLLLHYVRINNKINRTFISCSGSDQTNHKEAHDMRN